MQTHFRVVPRPATPPFSEVRREGRRLSSRARLVAAVAGLALAGALGACSPGSSGVPLPSVNVSGLPGASALASAAAGAASAATGAALTALDAVDAAITANSTTAGLTADESSSLTQLSAALRTALGSGDTSAIRTAVTNLSSKVDSLASKLSASPAGKQLTDAIAALKAAIPAS